MRIQLCRPCRRGIPLNDRSLQKHLIPIADLRGKLRLGLEEHEEYIGSKVQVHKKCDTLPDLPRISYFAQAGCRLCSLLLEDMLLKKYAYRSWMTISFEYIWEDSVYQQGRLTGFTATATHKSEEGDIISDKMMFIIDTNQGTCLTLILKGKDRSGLQLLTKPDDGCANWLGLRYLPEDMPLSSKNVDMVKKSLEMSIKSCCPLDSNADEVPTRLIDVGLGPDTPPRLVVCSDSLDDNQTRNLDYATLSCCWGPPEHGQLTTKTGTLQERLIGIPENILPAVLRDAVHVCRALEFRYLWADCLCVIQDDEVDWGTESPKMGEYYARSKLTICALASSTATQGFLQRSTKSVWIPFRSRLQDECSGTYRLTHWHKLDPLALASLAVGDYQLCTWSTRGWTYQEEQMSKRLLFFGNNRVHFICCHMQHTENLDSEDGTPFFLRTSSLVTEYQSDGESSAQTMPEAYDGWYAIAAVYNVRQLTYQSDKLPAISGLVNVMNKTFNDQYLAGLWLNDLPRGLMWQVGRDGQFLDSWESTTQTGTDTVLPSWTWARCNKDFEMQVAGYYVTARNTFRPEITNISPMIGLAGVDPFGRLEYGKLKVSGRLMSCPSTIYLASSPCQVLMFDKYAYHFTLDWAIPAQGQDISDGLVMLKVLLCEDAYGTENLVDFGLLIHNTGLGQEYRRVGLFRSEKRPKDSLDPFNECEPQEIILV